MHWDFWLILAVLGVVLPWRGRARLKKILAAPAMSSRERLLLYASTIAFQWVAAGFTAWRVWARGLSREELGLVVHDGGRVAGAAVAGAAVLAGLQWLNLRRMGRSVGKTREFMQALAERILPHSPRELVPFLGLCLTAGLCEEFLYRGFAMAAFARVGFPDWAAVLTSAVLFGLAHLYQGRGGLVGTLLIGVVFGIARIAYHGLIPVAGWHFAIDAVAGVAGPRYLVRRKLPVQEASA